MTTTKGNYKIHIPIHNDANKDDIFTNMQNISLRMSLLKDAESREMKNIIQVKNSDDNDDNKFMTLCFNEDEKIIDESNHFAWLGAFDLSDKDYEKIVRNIEETSKDIILKWNNPQQKSECYKPKRCIESLSQLIGIRFTDIPLQAEIQVHTFPENRNQISTECMCEDYVYISETENPNSDDKHLYCAEIKSFYIKTPKELMNFIKKFFIICRSCWYKDTKFPFHRACLTADETKISVVDYQIIILGKYGSINIDSAKFNEELHKDNDYKEITKYEYFNILDVVIVPFEVWCTVDNLKFAKSLHDKIVIHK